MDDVWIWMILIICAINTIMCEVLRRSIKQVDKMLHDRINEIIKDNGLDSRLWS